MTPIFLVYIYIYIYYSVCAWVQRDSDIVKGQFKTAKRPDSDTQHKPTTATAHINHKVQRSVRMFSSSASATRLLISQNSYTQMQANVAIIPSKFADAFETFCTLNPSACPLLYRSKPGEYEAPPLASKSDIR